MFDNLHLSDWLLMMMLGGIYLVLKELEKISVLISQLITNTPSRDQANKMNEQLGSINSNTSKPRELSDIEKEFENDRPYYKAIGESNRLEKLNSKSIKIDDRGDL